MGQNRDIDLQTERDLNYLVEAREVRDITFNPELGIPPQKIIQEARELARTTRKRITCCVYGLKLVFDEEAEHTFLFSEPNLS